MSGGAIFFGVMVVIFFIVAIATFNFISNKIGNDDTKEDVSAAIQTLTVWNVILVISLGFISFMYTNNNPLVRPTYNLVMIHISFLFSLTAVGIASIQKFS